MIALPGSLRRYTLEASPEAQDRISMEHAELQAMAEKLDRLIERCRKLEQDNAAMRELQDEWNRERAQLMQRNDLARHKIEAMIGRLRALEQH